MYEQKTDMYEQNRSIVLVEQYIEKPAQMHMEYSS